MLNNTVTFEQMCKILQQNPNISTLRNLIRKATELGFDSFKHADAWMALGWMRQFRITKEPIFFKQTDKGLVITFKGLPTCFQNQQTQNS